MYVYKGLLVVFSLFLAYESRNVKSYYINDSRYVIVSLLSAVLLIGLGAPVSLVLSLFYIPNGAYIVAVLCIILASVCSTTILFFPKVYFIILHFNMTIVISDGLDVPRQGDICKWFSSSR